MLIEIEKQKKSNQYSQEPNVSGHGAVTFPPPRNNIDHGEKPWSDGVPNPVPAVDDPKNGFWCPIPSPFFDDQLTGIYMKLVFVNLMH